MGQGRLKEWDRLSRELAAACLFLLLMMVCLCAVAQAGNKEGRAAGVEGETAGDKERVPAQEEKGVQPSVFHQGFLTDMDGSLYFYDQEGEMVRSRFLTIVDKDTTYVYYFCSDGKAAKGLKKTRRGQYYYFNEYGLMLVDAVRMIENKVYYFGEGGQAEWVLERFCQ